MDAAKQVKVLLPALLDANKMVPVLDAALNSASKVIYVPAIMVRNQIYAGIYVTKQLHFLDALLPELDAALISALN